MGTVTAVRFRIEKQPRKYNRLDKAAVADYWAANADRGITYAQAAKELGAKTNTLYCCCKLMGLNTQHGIERLRSRFDAKYGAGALDDFIEARRKRTTLHDLAVQFGFTFQQAHYYWRRLSRLSLHPQKEVEDVEIRKP